MSIFVGASGQVAVGDPYGGASQQAAYGPDKPFFWTLIILVALVAAVVVIARGAA